MYFSCTRVYMYLYVAYRASGLAEQQSTSYQCMLKAGARLPCDCQIKLHHHHTSLPYPDRIILGVVSLMVQLSVEPWRTQTARKATSNNQYPYPRIIFCDGFGQLGLGTIARILSPPDFCLSFVPRLPYFVTSFVPKLRTRLLLECCAKGTSVT